MRRTGGVLDGFASDHPGQHKYRRQPGSTTPSRTASTLDTRASTCTSPATLSTTSDHRRRSRHRSAQRRHRPAQHHLELHPLQHCALIGRCRKVCSSTADRDREGGRAWRPRVASFNDKVGRDLGTAGRRANASPPRQGQLRAGDGLRARNTRRRPTDGLRAHTASTPGHVEDVRGAADARC